jgi:hypothetical protein
VTDPAPAKKTAPRAAARAPEVRFDPARNIAPAFRKAAPARAAEKPALPEHKPDLAALAISRGVPSYVAWNTTVDDLKKMLEA